MKHGKKISGGRYHKRRKRKKYEMKFQPTIVKLGEPRKRKVRTRGGHFKTILLSTNLANVFDKKAKKSFKVKIKNVIETPSNKFLARQNVLIKGALIETEKGRARITNRPSQESAVQAELLNETSN